MQLKIKDDRGKSIGYLYGWIEKTKSGFAISDYSATTTTLEQVFNYFAKGAQKGPAKMNRMLTHRATLQWEQQKRATVINSSQGEVANEAINADLPRRVSMNITQIKQKQPVSNLISESNE